MNICFSPLFAPSYRQYKIYTADDFSIMYSQTCIAYTIYIHDRKGILQMSIAA